MLCALSKYTVKMNPKEDARRIGITYSTVFLCCYFNIIKTTELIFSLLVAFFKNGD